MIPANAGAEAEVPPITPNVINPENPPDITQGLEASLWQYRNPLPLNPGLASSETSGKSRFPSLGIPAIPTCQLGLLYFALGPPPAATMFRNASGVELILQPLGPSCAQL
jgi:hypothetical protein